MATMTIYEKRILKEIRGLPESAMEKIEKVILLLKQDFLNIQSCEDESDESTKRLLALCGSWKDTRTVDEQIRDIYESRTSIEEREMLK